VAAQNLTFTMCMRVLEDFQLVRLDFRLQSGDRGGHASFNELRLDPVCPGVKARRKAAGVPESMIATRLERSRLSKSQ
jgi:hypothetical protein